MREYDDHDEPDARDDYDREPRGGTPFPVGARVAGIIWIVFGTVGLVAQLASFGMNANQGGAGATGPICGILFAVAFLMIGIQTVRGTAKTTLANGIGSIIFSLVYFGLGAMMALGGAFLANANPQQAQAQGVQQFAIIMSVVLFGFGGLLLIAGVLAIMANTAYKDWRRAEGLTPSSRRRPARRDDDYDDYEPRDRRRDDDDFEPRPRRGDE